MVAGVRLRILRCAASLLGQEGWLRMGYEVGWCGPPVCATHDGVPCTDEEDETEACVHIVRLYQTVAEVERVETAHPPSIWRAVNRGWLSDDGEKG